ncbi:metal ABC transporter permease [Mycolicibacterium mageritense]|uniref:Manganese transport system membrane protein MntB n=1 Tax=Mycolicibacterium mageritense TaxID=53462 RepID=A0AAI8U118_MYCME|nr:metal ABC transporter permease [Mycolicibacterium mageritense]TXI64206.1 MAG: metal ABC transporter permease [Mycolicibacterium mageritense]BDY32252.1 Manganese transport system membrane protein MntB [Mycolicibacterium mageritense]
MSWCAWLVAPFSYDFMVRAAIATAAVCVAAPLCGIWALSRRLVYLTDAMSHGILAGVAAASLLGSSLLVGGLIAAVAMALFVSVLAVRARVPEDGAIGVVGQGLFALGVVGVSLQSDPRALAHILFGNPLTVDRTDVIVDSALAVSVTLAITALRPVLLATTFDAAHARTVGIRVGLVDSTLLVVLSLTVVGAMVTVGVLMAVTLVIAPAVTARLLGRSLNAMLAIAIGAGLTAGTIGLLMSYHASLPTGPTVAITAVAQVALAAMWARPVRALHRTVVRASPTSDHGAAATRGRE